MKNNIYFYKPYKKIRQLSYKTEKKVLKNLFNIDIYDWKTKPYTCFKIRFYIEISSFFVFLLQFTTIKPNQISYLYASTSIVGAIFLSLNSPSLIILGAFLFFFKIAIDGTDGLLARVKYKPTNFGAIIDTWGGLVSEVSFMVGLGFYLFNSTFDQIYLLMMILSISLIALDLKRYLYSYIGAAKYNGSYLLKEKNIGKIKLKNKTNKLIKLFKNLILNGFNYNAKTMDLILLGILFELTYEKIIVTHYFFYIYLVRGFIIFFGNVYLLNYDNNFVSNVLKNKIKYKKKNK